MSNPIQIPKDHEQPFFSIPHSEIMKRMDENRARFAQSSFQIGNSDGMSFRSLCRKELLALAVGRQHLERANISDNRRIILSGHQPFLNHPGVWIKIFLLALLAKENDAVAVNLEVDSDTAGSMSIPFPRKESHIKVVWENLISGHEERTLDSIPAPNSAEWNDFVARVAIHSRTIPNPAISERVKALGRIGGEILENGEKNLSGFFTELRLRYETPANLDYRTLPLSAACGTESFLLFFLGIAGDAQRFAEVYNLALEDYRTRHKLRTKANPFPNLLVRDSLYEVPFWWINESGCRHPIFVSPGPQNSDSGGMNLTLKFEKGETSHFDGLASQDILEKLRDKSIKIRPKALALTIFFRLFFCDLFIHGIGGAKYDEAADFIIKDYFGVAPPHFLAASLTLYPDLGITGPPTGEMKRLQTSLREMKFKPEKFISFISEEKNQSEFNDLCLKKKALLENSRKGEKGKKFFREMTAMNETLFSFLKPTWLDYKRKLDTYEKRKLEEKALRFREYPFCLFDPLELAKISRKC